MRKTLVIVSCLMGWAVAPLLAEGPPEKLSDVVNVPVAPVAAEVDQGNGGQPIVTDGLTWFDNKPAFDAAVGALICLEDWEASNLPPNSVLGFNDPLCGGTACAPPGCPYPNGSKCKELCFQSNLGGGNPANPNPRGANGIAAASAGFLGATSDLILANTFVDSADHIISVNNVMAVGGNTIDALGGGSVEVRVYDQANNLLGQARFPANIQGTNFMGVLSDVAIGRVNVFSPGGGAEGLDNIQLHEAGGPSETCVYETKKMRQRKCIDSGCPQPQGCVITTEDRCQNVGDCDKKQTAKLPCNNPDEKGKCKHKMIRCDCR